MSKQKNSLFELSSTSLYVNDPDQYIYSHQQYELPPDILGNKEKYEFLQNSFLTYV